MDENTRSVPHPSLARTVADWLTIFSEQTNGRPEDIADRVISDLWGYNTRTKSDDGRGRWRDLDIVSLANALRAIGDRV